MRIVVKYAIDPAVSVVTVKVTGSRSPFTPTPDFQHLTTKQENVRFQHVLGSLHVAFAIKISGLIHPMLYLPTQQIEERKN